MHSAALISVAAILVLIIVSSVASASIAETRITTHGTASDPDIYNNKIIWTDTRSGNFDLYVLDLSNKKETHTSTEIAFDDYLRN